MPAGAGVGALGGGEGAEGGGEGVVADGDGLGGAVEIEGPDVPEGGRGEDVGGIGA